MRAATRGCCPGTVCPTRGPTPRPGTPCRPRWVRQRSGSATRWSTSMAPSPGHKKNIWYKKDALGIFEMNWFYILTHNDKLQTPFRSCQKTYTGGETFASCFSNSAEGFLSEVTWSVSTFLEQDWDVSAPLNSAMTLHISIHREQRRSSSFGSSSSSLLGWCAGSEDWRLCWNMIDIFLLLWLFRIKFQVIISCWSWNFDWYN